MAKDKERESDDWDEFDMATGTYEFMHSFDDSAILKIRPKNRSDAARALEIRREQLSLNRELSDWDIDDDL